MQLVPEFAAPQVQKHSPAEALQIQVGVARQLLARGEEIPSIGLAMDEHTSNVQSQTLLHEFLYIFWPSAREAWHQIFCLVPGGGTSNTRELRQGIVNAKVRTGRQGGHSHFIDDHAKNVPSLARFLPPRIVRQTVGPHPRVVRQARRFHFLHCRRVV